MKSHIIAHKSVVKGDIFGWNVIEIKKYFDPYVGICLVNDPSLNTR